MLNTRRLVRPLAITGIAGMLLGAVDPLEGSVVILAGTALVAWGAALGRMPELRQLACALALVTVGVAALWGLSALGGFGGTSRLSNWWGVLLVPYPVGWIVGLVGGFRLLRDLRARSVGPTAR